MRGVLPMVRCAPRSPIEAETPLLLRLRRSPGAMPMRF